MTAVLTADPTHRHRSLALPEPKGAASAAVLDFLHGGKASLDDVRFAGDFDDEDANLAIHLACASQTAAFDGVDIDRLDHPALMGFRHRALRWFERRVRAMTPRTPAAVPIDRLLDHVLAEPGVDLGSHLDRRPGRIATMFIAKAPYLLHEADAHTMALVRLEPDLQRVIAEIQAGEYGVGHRSTHAELYRSCLRALDVAPTEALDLALGEHLALSNLSWLFSSSYRLRGAAVGQLALFEVDSVEPCTRAVAWWNAAGLPADARRWYDVHTLADMEHARIIEDALLPLVSRQRPDFIEQFRFGVDATQALQQHVARVTLRRWTAVGR